MQKNPEVPKKIPTGNQPLRNQLESITIVFLTKAFGSNVVKIVNPPEVDHNDDEPKKEE